MTYRISQRGRGWPALLKKIIERLGNRAWLYQEGQRGVWVVETSRPLTQQQLNSADSTLGYVRGYFDAEGGIPREPSARFYIQFVQKNETSLRHLRKCLDTFSVRCGALHNPSHASDPDYWRFYVSADSHQRFIATIGSWHPRKRPLLMNRA